MAPSLSAQRLVDYWQKGFDWRRQEREINRFSHYKTTIEGIPIHFIHEPGKGTKPIPLILSHGWPWTFWDLHKVIRPLADPAAFGGYPRTPSTWWCRRFPAMVSPLR